MCPSRVLPALLGLLLPLAGQSPDREQEADTLPGAVSWTQFRGDPGNTGVSHSPRPAYRGVAWKYFTGANVVSTPAVADGKLIVPTEFGLVHAVDAVKGKKVWSRLVGSGEAGKGIVQSSPLIHDGRVYVGTKVGVLHCLDLATGEPVFAAPLAPGGKGKEPEEIFASPKGDDRGIVVGAMDGTTYCLDPATGDVRWKVEKDRPTGATVAILGDRVYQPSKDRLVYEIDYGTGRVVRTMSLPGTTHCTPALGLGYLFVKVGDGKTVALNLVPGIPGAPEDGPAWTAETWGQTKTAVAYAAGRVFVPTGGELRCLDARSGDQLWSQKLTHRVKEPVVNGKEVLVTTQDGWLRVLRVEDGKEVHAWEFPDRIHAGPVLAGGRIYVGTMGRTDSWVYCVE